MEPIKFAMRIAVRDPDEGVLKGNLWGFFDGRVGEPEMAPWFRKQIELHFGEAVAALGPPRRALGDKTALAREIETRMRDVYQTCAAEGHIVIEGVALEGDRAPKPQVAATAFAPPPPPRIPSRPVTPRIIDPLNVTADGVMSPFAGRDALPFQKGEGAAVPKSALDVTAGARAGATAAIPAFEPPDIEVLPFDEDHPELTVEQYASLCVERALHPDEENETAKRYKVLTEKALRSLDKRWHHRFDKEGELHRRWKAAYAQYEAWVKSQKR